jgi:3-phosphoshikimate 1-carboxyvinyltransferase
MLKLFKAKLEVRGNKITIRGDGKLVSPKKIYVPGDISSAAFFLVAAALSPKSHVLIRNVNLNPSRTGILKVLKRMGANIKITKSLNRLITHSEPMGDLSVKTSSLKGTVVKKEEIPSLIDELPVLMVAAALARGKTIFKGAAELRVKETDRIRSMTENLKKMGADIKIKRNYGEDIVINGVRQLKGARVRSFNDHRTAMSMAVAGLSAAGKTYVDDISCISKSFPDFIRILKGLIK